VNFSHPFAALCIALTVPLPALAQRPLSNALSDPAVLRGLAQIEVTASPNAIGRIPGTSGKAIVIAAVAEEETGWFSLSVFLTAITQANAN